MVFLAKVPYANKCAEEIKCIVSIDDDFNNEKKLSSNIFETIDFPFSRIVTDGLNIIPIRRMKFQEVRNQLEHQMESINQQHVCNYI